MHRLLSWKILFTFTLCIATAVASAWWLGSPLGWLGERRGDSGLLLGQLLPFLQFLVLAALLSQLMWGLAESPARDPKAVRVPRLALQIGHFLIYAVLIAAAINLVFEQSLTTILGASGVIGLVLGFALRGLVADLFSGIALQLDRSIGIGDCIEFQYRGRDLAGRLMEISWRTVVLDDFSENIVLIPNGEFASLLVFNRSRPHPVSEYNVTLDLGAEHDESRIISVLQSALNRAAHEGFVASRPAPYVRIAAVREGGVSYRLLYCVEVNRYTPPRPRHVVLSYALQSLKAAGIPVTRTTHTDISRPAAVGAHHIDQPQARLQMLGSVPFLGILPPEDLATVAAEVETLRLGASETVLTAGDAGDSMFVVSEGSLEVTVDRGESLLTVGRLWPGDCVGEMSLLTGAPRSANVRTLVPSVLFKVRKETMAHIFSRNTSLVQRFADMMALRQQSTESAFNQAVTTSANPLAAGSLLSSIRRFFRL